MKYGLVFTGSLQITMAWIFLNLSTQDTEAEWNVKAGSDGKIKARQ